MPSFRKVKKYLLSTYANIQFSLGKRKDGGLSLLDIKLLSKKELKLISRRVNYITEFRGPPTRMVLNRNKKIILLWFEVRTIKETKNCLITLKKVHQKLKNSVCRIRLIIKTKTKKENFSQLIA